MHILPQCEFLAYDQLIYAYSSEGREKWKTCIYNEQRSQGNDLGLSVLAEIKGHQLRILTNQSKGGKFYLLDINASTGALSQRINLLPGERFEYARKYSCLLDDHTVLLCGIAPGNLFKRKLMLVEF